MDIDFGKRSVPGVNGYLATTFFYPTEEFMDWLKEFLNDRPVVEIGCGRGHLMDKMKGRGINCLGIDIYPPPMMYPETLPIMEYDGSEFDYPKGCVAIMARPSRGVWIERSIAQALLTADCVVYIGKECHFDDDIYPLQDDYHIEGSAGRVGDEGEQVFIITKEKEDDGMKKAGLPPIDDSEDDVIDEPKPVKPHKLIAPPEPDVSKGPPCSKCLQIYYYDFYGFRQCKNCNTINIDGFNPKEPFDFSVHKDKDGEFYKVNCKRLPKDHVDEYLVSRPGGDYDRVFFHRVVMHDAGMEYTAEDGRVEQLRFNCDWFDYFEEWIEAYLRSDEGEATLNEVCKRTCTACGATIGRHDGAWNGPGGPHCMKCFRSLRHDSIRGFPDDDDDDY